MVGFGSSWGCPLSPALTAPLPHTPGPPIIVVPPQNVTVNISQDAFLACQAEAYPGNLTYTWFQGSSNVFHLRYGGNGDGTGAAVPPKPGPECPGQAGCVVGENPSPQGSKDGPNYATHCYPLPSPPSHLQARVRVLVDGSLLLQRTTPDDAGKYTCTPSNGLWKPPSASAFITVLCKTPPCPPEPWGSLLWGLWWDRGVPHGDPSPVCPRRPSAGDHHAPGDPPAQGHAGRDPLPLPSQSPPALRHLDEGRAPAGAGQGMAAPTPHHPSHLPKSLLLSRSPLPAPRLVRAARRLHRHCHGERRCAGAVPLHALQQLRHRRRVPAHARPAEGEEPPGVPSLALHALPSPPCCPSALQDPPAFTVRPKEEYFQEVGRELVIPCAARGDPPPTITWLKVGVAAALGGQLSPPRDRDCFWSPGHHSWGSVLVPSHHSWGNVPVPTNAVGSHHMVPEGPQVTLLDWPLKSQQTSAPWLPNQPQGGGSGPPFQVPLSPVWQCHCPSPARGWAGGGPHQHVHAPQVGSMGKSSAQVDGNSSLVLHPLIKEQHGVWECTATNQVASVTTATSVHVLGELPVTAGLGWSWGGQCKPHPMLEGVVRALQCDSAACQVPVPTLSPMSPCSRCCWQPTSPGSRALTEATSRGSVSGTPRCECPPAPCPPRGPSAPGSRVPAVPRARYPPRAHHDWVSLSVPAGAQHLLVENLQPDTSYQFSVLAQNKLGSGPFSQIVTSMPRGKGSSPKHPRCPQALGRLPFPPCAGLCFLPRLPSDHSASGAAGHDRARLPVPTAGSDSQ